MTELSRTQLQVHVDDLQRELKKLHHEARHDKLTGLPNRRGFDEDVGEGEGLYIAIDLNHFKRKQDQHPLKHEFGDLVLRAFAEFLVANVRTGDRIPCCRKGGDEFILWCPTYVGAMRVRSILLEWSYCGVTASVGIGRTVQSADIRMYENKADRTRPWWRRAVFAVSRRLRRAVKCQELKALREKTV